MVYKVLLPLLNAYRKDADKSIWASKIYCNEGTLSSSRCRQIYTIIWTIWEREDISSQKGSDAGSDAEPETNAKHAALLAIAKSMSMFADEMKEMIRSDESSLKFMLSGNGRLSHEARLTDGREHPELGPFPTNGDFE